MISDGSMLKPETHVKSLDQPHKDYYNTYKYAQACLSYDPCIHALIGFVIWSGEIAQLVKSRGW